MKRTALLLLVIAGCGPWVETTQSVKPTLLKETVWTCIADDIDAGDITDSTKLELMVKRLRSRSRIADADVEKFYSAIGGERTSNGILKHERAITAEDSAKIRGIE